MVIKASNGIMVVEVGNVGLSGLLVAKDGRVQ
jgi:hypothetical protein